MLSQPDPFIPFHGSSPAEAWYSPFLRHFAVHGGRALAAAAAGVRLKAVERALATDPVFAEEFHEARRYNLDLIEFESLSLGRRKGNPLPYFNRLRADQPDRHIERLQVASVTVDLTPEPADLRETMIRMLRNITPSTRRLLLQRPEGLRMLEDPEYREAFLSGAEADERLALPESTELPEGPPSG